MPTLQTLLDAVDEQIIDVHTGPGSPEFPSCIEFLACAAPQLDHRALYLLNRAELPELVRRAPLPPATFLIVCGNDAPPELPAELSGTASFVFLRGELLPIYSLLNRAMDEEHIRRRVDDIVLIAENAQYTPEHLVFALSAVLHVGVYILNPTYQRICGTAGDFSGNPYAEELAATGALSATSIRQINNGGDGDPRTVLYEVPIGKWSRFNLLLIWRDGSRIDPQYLCMRLSEFVINYRNKSEPLDIPPILVDQRLNRILEGKTADESEICAFFGVGGTPVWFAVFVLGSEPGVRRHAEAYQEQARLLRSAFRSISVTVAHSHICGVIRIPLLRSSPDSVFFRDILREHAFSEGWDSARLERELQQQSAYFCCSRAFRYTYLFPAQHSLVTDALDIALRLDGCRGRHITDYHDYISYVAVKYTVERFLQKYEPRALRALVCPELGTLMSYDLKNRTDLTDVLYHYYSYGGVNRAAQALFVHRNTVYNKLKAIQKILNVDPDDPSIRSSYFTSLKVIYYCERCLGLDLHPTD